MDLWSSARCLLIFCIRSLVIFNIIQIFNLIIEHPEEKDGLSFSVSKSQPTNF